MLRLNKTYLRIDINPVNDLLMDYYARRNNIAPELI
jgi:hypothetical protein